MSTVAKTKEKRPTQNLGAIDAELHRLLKIKAITDGKSLRDLLEQTLGRSVGWKQPTLSAA